MINRAAKPERIYVTVTSTFDAVGYVKPCSITWADGRVFKIDAVKDFRPANSVSATLSGDCYTVVIHGTEKHLFFEPYSERFSGRLGRWFVEAQRA